MTLSGFLLSAALVSKPKNRSSALSGLKIAGSLPGTDMIKSVITSGWGSCHSQMLSESFRHGGAGKLGVTLPTPFALCPPGGFEVMFVGVWVPCFALRCVLCFVPKVPKWVRAVMCW